MYQTIHIIIPQNSYKKNSHKIKIYLRAPLVLVLLAVAPLALVFRAAVVTGAFFAEAPPVLLPLAALLARPAAVPVDLPVLLTGAATALRLGAGLSSDDS